MSYNKTMNKNNNILEVLAKKTKELRGDISQFVFCQKNHLSTSILSMVERAIKDPQLTTVFKLAKALGVRPSQYIKFIEEDLPRKLKLLEK